MHKEHEELTDHTESVGRSVVEAALVVHRALGPRLLETAYETCLADEIARRGHRVDRQLSLPIVFRGKQLDSAYRIDLLIDRLVVVEIKAIEVLLPLHDAQLLTYLRLSGHRLGYLINFNTALVKQGIRRKIL